MHLVVAALVKLTRQLVMSVRAHAEEGGDAHCATPMTMSNEMITGIGMSPIVTENRSKNVNSTRQNRRKLHVARKNGWYMFTVGLRH